MLAVSQQVKIKNKKAKSGSLFYLSANKSRYISRKT